MKRYKKLFETTIDIFSKKGISIIGNWLEYGASDNVSLQKIQQLNIPKNYKEVNKFLYRIVGVPKDFIKGDIRYYKTKNLSSWSYSLKVVQNFLYSTWFSDLNDPEKNEAVIFKYKPKSDEIFFNLDFLWKEGIFSKTIKDFEDKGIYFYSSGLELENDQQEVILNQLKLTTRDIYLIWDINKQKWRYFKND